MKHLFHFLYMNSNYYLKPLLIQKQNLRSRDGGLLLRHIWSKKRKRKEVKVTSLGANKLKQNRLVCTGTSHARYKIQACYSGLFRSLSITVRAAATYWRLIIDRWPCIVACDPTNWATTDKTREICQVAMYPVAHWLSDPVQQSNRSTLYVRVTS